MGNMYQYGNVAVKQEYKKRKRVQPPQKPVPGVESQKKSYSISVGEKLIYIIAVIFVVAVTTVLLSQQSSASEINFEIQALESEQNVIMEQNAKLELEVASLRSPERIIAIAKEELGMSVKNSNVTTVSHHPDRESNLD